MLATDDDIIGLRLMTGMHPCAEPAYCSFAGMRPTRVTGVIDCAVFFPVGMCGPSRMRGVSWKARAPHESIAGHCCPPPPLPSSS
jgi:hypothetical protein